MKVPDQFAARTLDLRPREREGLGLRYFEQFEVPDIAHILNIRLSSVSGHLSEGIAATAKILETHQAAAREVLTDTGSDHVTVLDGAPDQTARGPSAVGYEFRRLRHRRRYSGGP